MALSTAKKRASAHRPIETARRETRRAITLARVEGRKGLVTDLEKIDDALREAKSKTV